MVRRVAARWSAWERRAGRFGAAPSAGTAGPVPSADTFPTTDLLCRVQIALTPDYSLPWWQWGWADITEYVRWDPGISVTDGRRDESGTVSTINGSMVLENDGRFSRRNVFGAYYPYLTRNTPIWAQVNPGSGWYDRLHGYVNAWPKRWDTTGTESVAPVGIGGIKRRLQKASTLHAPLHAAILADEPDAMWALDDGSDATTGASALSDGSAMTVSAGTPIWASVDPPAGGSTPLVNIGNCVIRGSVASSATTAWTFELIANTVELAAGLDGYIAAIYTTAGTIFQIFTQTAQPLPLAVEVIGGSTLSASGQQADFDNQWHHFLVKVELTGTDVDGELWYDGQLIASGNFYGSASSLPSPRTMVINSVRLSTMAGGYAAVHGHADIDAAARYQAMLAWVGEQAHARMARVCTENDIPFAAYAGSETSTLGPQPVGTALDVLADAEKADRGVLYEHEFGLAYKGPRDYYDQPVHLTIDQAQGQLAEYVEADDDDQTYTNQWTAKRTDGSESTYRDPDYSAGDALFAGGDTYNVQTDGQLPHIAGWEVHKGIVDEDRWPMLAIDLANHPELIAEWTAMPFGGRVQVDNPHEQVGVDLIDAIREGRTEHWNSKQWTARMNTTPASTHQVARYAPSAVPSRYDTRGSTLSAAVSDSATSWTVAIADGYPLWVTTATHPDVFPLNIKVGGLVYAVSAITGAVTDTFTRTVVDGWGSADTGQAWTLSGGTNPGNYDVTGTQGTHTLDSVNVRRHSSLDTSDTDFDVYVDVTLPVVPTGAAITLWLAARFADTSNYYTAYLSVATSGAVTLAIGERVGGVSADLASVAAGTHAASDTWRIRFQGISTALKAKTWNVTGGASEPAAWQVETTDGSLTAGTSVGLLTRKETGNTNGTVTVAWDNLDTRLTPLTFVVTRLATDKAHAAGSSVRVYLPPIYGL